MVDVCNHNMKTSSLHDREPEPEMSVLQSAAIVVESVDGVAFGSGFGSKTQHGIRLATFVGSLGDCDCGLPDTALHRYYDSISRATSICEAGENFPCS